MIVQVRPDGWSAKCSRHGELDSKDLESAMNDIDATAYFATHRAAVIVVAGLSRRRRRGRGAVGLAGAADSRRGRADA